MFSVQLRGLKRWKLPQGRWAGPSLRTGHRQIEGAVT
jgi:hypothetical protein